MACNPISAASLFCENLRTPGAKAFVRLIPLDDWLAATVTVDATSNNITAITLAAGGKQAYKYECGQPANLVSTSVFREVSGGLDGYDHVLDLKLMYKDQAQRDEIVLMKYNKVVAILELNNGDAFLYGGSADATPEPQGIGLRLTGGEENPGDATVGGLTPIILATSPDGPAEPGMPFVVDKTVDLTTLDTPTA